MSNKVIQFPGTQPFMYKGRKVCLSIRIWPGAKGSKTFKWDEEGDCYWLAITAINFERAMSATNQFAEEMGFCL